MNVNGSRVAVIGGASGMARATAELMASRGARIAVLDRPGTGGSEVAASVNGSFHVCDVTDYAGTEHAIAGAVEALGGVDVGVTTAGGGIAARTVGREGPHSLDDFRAVVELNLFGTFNVDRLLAWHMASNEPNDDGERGVLIHTASIAAFEGQIGQVAYSAAKGAIVAMTLTMARDLGSLGIRVCTIAPSLFATGLSAGIPPDHATNLTKDAAFPKRMGRPEEYARMALSIVENAMVNGSTIRLDGGQRFAPR